MQEAVVLKHHHMFMVTGRALGPRRIDDEWRVVAHQLLEPGVAVGPTRQQDADGKAHVINALTGLHVAPLPASKTRLLAGAQYEGSGQPAVPRWFAVAPQEAGRPGPLWRVDFDDAERTSFYLSPETGEVVSRRSNVWRIYDVFWRIHILDFKTGSNFNHPLIIAAAALTLPVVITGLILLWIRLGRDLKSLLARRRGG